jgi:hypothetical protein
MAIVRRRFTSYEPFAIYVMDAQEWLEERYGSEMNCKVEHGDIYDRSYTENLPTNSRYQDITFSELKEEYMIVVSYDHPYSITGLARMFNKHASIWLTNGREYSDVTQKLVFDDVTGYNDMADVVIELPDELTAVEFKLVVG